MFCWNVIFIHSISVRSLVRIIEILIYRLTHPLSDGLETLCILRMSSYFGDFCHVSVSLVAKRIHYRVVLAKLVAITFPSRPRSEERRVGKASADREEQ